MQATITQTQKASPDVPNLPAPDRATVVINNVDGSQQTLPLPMNAAEVNALKSQRSELSNQLVSAAGRRRELANQLRSAQPGADQTGLEQRIAVLDKRMVQLESDIAATGRQLSAAPLDVISSAERPNVDDIPDNVAAMGATFMGLVLFPLTIVLARNLWKRGSRSNAPAPQQLAGDSGQQLERLEHGMEAIAIEIERVAEGQRFVTRLLSEAQPGQSVSINRSTERASTS